MTTNLTKQQLLAEVAGLRLRLEEAEETLHAIRHGEVDALVVSGPAGNSVFTLSGADRPYRVLIEAISEGALTLSLDGTILYSNVRFAEMVQTPLEHVIGAALKGFARLEDQYRVTALIARSNGSAVRGKFTLALPDGVTVPVHLSARQVDLDDLQAICVVVTDLREIVAAEEALRQAHDTLERRVEERTAALRHANEMRLRFLAMISHELRTPLQSIKGFATTLLANDVTWDSAAQQDFIATIDTEADKLTDMIEQILDLSSLEAGILHINPTPATLRDILAAVSPELERIAHDHELRVDAPADLPIIKADRERVAQVLVNLVSNAAKYSPPHTAIRISARQDGECLRVTVSDEGPGIPQEERPYIFEAFQRGEGARRVKGAGLGLAICKGLVEAHGGRIWIAEQAGPGTSVSFLLPVPRSANGATGAP